MPRGMLPEIRAAYKQALAELRAAGQEAKPLYHYSRDPDSLLVAPKTMSTGEVANFEPWKPHALYASDNLIDNMASTVGEYGLPPKTYVQQMGGANHFVRIVPKPNAHVYETSEKDLQGLLNRMNAKYGRPTHAETNQVEGRGKEVWDRIFRDRDIVRIKGVDDDPELVENLIRNPKAVRIFSKDKAWLPALMASVLGIGATAGDAEAITPMQFWKATKAAGYDSLNRVAQARLARAIRNLPKQSMDKIGQVYTDPSNPSRATNFSKITGPSNRSFNDLSFEAHPTSLLESKVSINPDQVYPTTPTHEGLHSVWWDMDPADKQVFIDRWNRFDRNGTLGMYEDTFQSTLQDPSELFAEYGAHRMQKTPMWEEFSGKLPNLSKQLDDVLTKYTKYGLPALASAVLFGSAGDAEAVMLPEVRKLMLEAQRLGGKKLFHSTLNPKSLMEAGLEDPKKYQQVKELHKPMGFYAADRVEKIPGHLSGMYDGTQTTQALREKLNRHMTSAEDMFNPETVGDTPIVRMILKPDAKVREIPETFMHDYNRELKSIRRDLRKIDGEPAPMLPLSETELTQHWQDLADVLKIDNVDGQPRLAEWLTLNPEKVQGMYWENMSWTPEGGTVTHGPFKKRKFGWPSERGASRSDLGLPPSSGKKWEADSVGGFEPPGPGPKPEAMNGFTDPNVAAKYYQEMYDQHISEGNEMMAEYALANAKQIKQYMKQQAGQSKLGIGQLNPYQPGEIKLKNYLNPEMQPNNYGELIDELGGKPTAEFVWDESGVNLTLWDQARNFFGLKPPTVGKYMPHQKTSYIDEMLSHPQYKKGLIAAALGVGGLVGSAGDADAMPLGKLKAINKPIANATRSTEEFYHLLGHKIQGKEVVDVLRNPKNDWRYVIVKDEKGKRFQLPMTKDYLNVYAGAKGTQDYLQRFRLEGYQGKKLQALKSLNIRENKRYATEDVKTAEFKEWNKSQMLKAKEIDPELVNDYAYVKVLNDEGGGTQGQSIYMPREYADFLAAKGYVKILKH